MKDERSKYNRKLLIKTFKSEMSGKKPICIMRFVADVITMLIAFVIIDLTFNNKMC